ncbi:MAG TPA: hypothetical protein VGM01_03185 [Ktedonobacteraceae bacterium]|jgi:hypothetical protein
MPKKTAYSRSGAQRNKTKQKSFELVRPASDENVIETVESSEGEESEEEDVVEIASSGSAEKEVEEVEEVKPKAGRSIGAKVSTPAAAAVVPNTSAGENSSPKSAAARMAARRQAAQKTQRSSNNLITVEHYNYVRKDLIFILILAIIMFGTIIALHFVLGG